MIIHKSAQGHCCKFPSQIIIKSEENYQNIVNEYQNQKFRENSKMINTEFRYYLKILTVQDSIATAKVTGKLFPFTQPQIGDKINIK